MKQITIYTDGACSGNPGPGGWGAVLDYKGTQREISGGEADTTNNRMEMMALISALRLLKEPCDITLCSDSKYVIDALQKGWAKGWRARGWVKADKKPALNSDLWAQMLDLCEGHKFTYQWIKGHAGHKENERCDALAVAQSQKYR
jgi:ribonuclease HI